MLTLTENHYHRPVIFMLFGWCVICIILTRSIPAVTLSWFKQCLDKYLFFHFFRSKCRQIKPEWGCTRSFLVLRRKTSWNVNRIIYWAFSICSIPELTPTTTHSIPTALLLLQSMPINLITMQHLQLPSPLSLISFYYYFDIRQQHPFIHLSII